MPVIFTHGDARAAEERITIVVSLEMATAHHHFFGQVEKLLSLSFVVYIRRQNLSQHIYGHLLLGTRIMTFSIKPNVVP